MEPERLKKEFGGKLIFHGGIDTQRALPFKMPDELEVYVKETLETLALGYILAPSHEIQGDVPPENVYVMYKAALSCSRG